MNRSLSTVAALVLLVLVGCGQSASGDDGGATLEDAGCDLDAGDSFGPQGVFLDAGTSVEWEQQCAHTPQPLRPGLAAGAFCTIAERCAQVSCVCAAVQKEYAARGCSDGRCVDLATACSWALQQEPRLCQ